MRRKSFDALASAGGVLLTVVLVVAGIALFWGYSYANSSVSSQLAAQKIVFPAKASLTPAEAPYLSKYAGELMTTGAQAQAYANHYIAVHLSEITGGQTYAQVSAAAMALTPGTAAYNAAQSKVQLVFQGTTLRGMLLNAYGWWQMGQIALLSSIAAFVAAVLAAILSVLGVWHFRRVPLDEEIPRLPVAQPVPVARTAERVPANA
jgi:hypothetical protein